MRLAFGTVATIVCGCITSCAVVQPSPSAFGGTLSLVHSAGGKQTFVLKNSGSLPLAYNHWFSLGPAPVAYCRGVDGLERFCSLRVMLAEDDQPYTHESYLQPGDSVKFQASPTADEQVGVHLWVGGREEGLWLDGWTPNTSLERTRGR